MSASGPSTSINGGLGLWTAVMIAWLGDGTQEAGTEGAGLDRHDGDFQLAA